MRKNMANIADILEFIITEKFITNILCDIIKYKYIMLMLI